VCCSVLQCVAVCGCMLQCFAMCCARRLSTENFPRPIIVARYSVLQCVAVCCSVWLYVAVFCNVLRWKAVDRELPSSDNCSTLQCVAVCCSVFTVCCSVM